MTGGEGLSRNPFVRRSSQRVGRTSWSTGSAWHKRPGVYGHCYCLTRGRTLTAVYHHSPTYIVTSLKTEDGKQKAHWKELLIFELTNRLHTHNQLHQEDINKSHKKHSSTYTWWSCITRSSGTQAKRTPAAGNGALHLPLPTTPRNKTSSNQNHWPPTSAQVTGWLNGSSALFAEMKCLISYSVIFSICKLLLSC